MEMVRTKSLGLVEERVEGALEGANAIIYGAPSCEKTYALERTAAKFRAAGKPVIYVYCGPRCTEAHLYRGIAEAAAIAMRSSLRWGCRYAVLTALRASAKLPALILDEAQHMDMDALEAVRQIHDLTGREGRPGCGIILAGSHGLLQQFLHPSRRARMEQMLSRFPYRIQLEGMTKTEILTLAARALGNGKPAKLSEGTQKTLLERCSVDDPYFIGPGGKPTLRTYYSSRRLLEFIRQQKKNVKSMLAESVT
jgi:DNA transposition AAA+ family ATPase